MTIAIIFQQQHMSRHIVAFFYPLFASRHFFCQANVMKSDPEGCGGKEHIIGIQTEKCIVAFEFLHTANRSSLGRLEFLLPRNEQDSNDESAGKGNASYANHPLQ
jgi:hypothetical protein